MSSPDALALFYRGVLASCNYDCSYCPFAKRRDTRATLAQDAADLQRFATWVAEHTHTRFNLLFTPWGEALTRRHYRDAIVYLSHLPHIERVAVQTNLSNHPHWLADANAGKVSLWCSYHPQETPRQRFLERIDTLAGLGVAHSVGMVGKRDLFAEIGALREQLPPHTYLWINAYWDEGRDYYRTGEGEWLSQIDPWFAFNLVPTPSLGVACAAGEGVLSVAGDGALKRCHFVPAHIGNLYTDSLASVLRPRVCPNTLCDCYIGYVQRKDLPFMQQFGVGALGRVPLDFCWVRPQDWSFVGPAADAPPAQ